MPGAGKGGAGQEIPVRISREVRARHAEQKLMQSQELQKHPGSAERVPRK